MQRPTPRRPCIRFAAPLHAAGDLSDSVGGRRNYQSYLERQAADGPGRKTRVYINLSRGWALGSREFKTSLVQDHKVAALSRAWETADAREIDELKWAYLLGIAP